MKKKKILFHALAIAVAASATTSLSSCVDTEEPESITALRQAKAEEVKAEAELLQAQVDTVKAYIAVVNANAKLAEAKAAAEELKNASSLAAGDVNKEEAIVKAQQSLTDAKLALQEQEIQNNVRLAALLEYGDANITLQSALSDLTTAQNKALTTQAALVTAVANDASSLQNAVDNAQVDLDQAKALKESFIETCNSNNVDVSVIVEEYKSYNSKVSSSIVEETKYQVEEAKLAGEVEALTDAYNNIVNASANAVTEYGDQMISVEFECSNETLNRLVESSYKGFTTFNVDKSIYESGSFLFDASTNKYRSSILVRQSDIKSVTTNLRTAFAAYADPYQNDYNNYEYIRTNLTNAAEEHKKEVESLKEVWVKAIDAYFSNEDATKIDALGDAIKDAAANLFGEKTSTVDGGEINVLSYDFHYFTNADVFEDAKVVDNIIQNESAPMTRSFVLINLGVYGDWILEKEKLTNNSEKDYIEAYDAAVEVVAAIDAKVKEFNDKNDELSKEQSDVVNSDEAKAAYKALQDKRAELNAKKVEHKKLTDETALNSAIAAQLSAVVSGLIGNNAEWYENQIELYDTGIANKETVLANAKKALDDFNAGKYDNSYIESLQEQLEADEAEVKAAEEKYNKLKAAANSSK